MRSLQIGHMAILVIALSGCGKKSATPVAENRPSPVASIPNPETTVAEKSPSDEMARLHQPFGDAVLIQHPGNQQLPPDRTMAGLSTVRLRMEVERQWDTIRFVDAKGKPIVYLATINSDFGTFRVQLRPEVAPNHVRNFVALANASYYNGLSFEHLISQDGDGPDSHLEMVEAGCPLGTGEPGIGHLGYWLRPEVDETLTHQPGSFGAYHDDEPETAACRFYITLTNAPAMDGNYTVFGQVVEGLDVVRTISKLPKVAGSFQPEKPAMIRNVTIETHEVR
ncbi:MAG: peptidylprolyl isomerase [Gemmataceae bacterium]